MIELVQVPWSPYCLAQKRILEFSGAPHKIINIPPADRSLVWRITKQRYYQVPVLKDGRLDLFETDEHSQVIAKYLDSKLNLGLFPQAWEGVQRILWRYIEGEIEGLTFRLNDAYYREVVPPAEQLEYLRYKERNLGAGASTNGWRSKRSWSLNSPIGWCPANRCSAPTITCSIPGRALSISTCGACWRTFSSRATIRCPPRTHA